MMMAGHRERLTGVAFDGPLAAAIKSCSSEPERSKAPINVSGEC